MKRLVRMHFRPEEVESFLEEFRIHRDKISGFNGCNHLELLRDPLEPEVFYTWSHWDGPEDLETYRNSDLFKSIWSFAKPKFQEPAQAWSFDEVD